MGDAVGVRSTPRSHLRVIGTCLFVAVVAFGAGVGIKSAFHAWWVIPRAYSNLSSDDGDVRERAIELLRKEGAETVPALIALLEHPNAQVNSFAMEFLGKERPFSDAVLEEFVSVLEREHPVKRVRVRAAETLGRHAELNPGPHTAHDTRAIAALQTALNDSELDVGRQAARSLSAYLPEASIHDNLERFIRDHDAIEIARIAYQFDPTFRDVYLDVLVQCLQSRYPDRAMLYLSELGPEAAGAVGPLMRLRTEFPERSMEIDEILRAIDASRPAPAVGNGAVPVTQ